MMKKYEDVIERQANKAQKAGKRFGFKITKKWIITLNILAMIGLLMLICTSKFFQGWGESSKRLK
jgi:hypothetical protein